MIRLISQLLLTLLLFLCTAHHSFAEQAKDDWYYNEIKRGKNGFLQRTSGDPYIVFPEIQESTCSAKGILLSVSFDPIPQKPVLLEMFWSTDYLGFGEENKVFFVVHPDPVTNQNEFIVPLSHTAGFRQIRLDFPNDLDSRFKINMYEVVTLSSAQEKYEVVDAYYNLSVEESLKPEVLIPYLLKALSHGPKRMTKDIVFLTFWLLLIFVTLILIRTTAKRLE